MGSADDTTLMTEKSNLWLWSLASERRWYLW